LDGLIDGQMDGWMDGLIGVFLIVPEKLFGEV